MRVMAANISLNMTVYNRDRYLEESIQSVLESISRNRAKILNSGSVMALLVTLALARENC
jgi:hypothetical protein